MQKTFQCKIYLGLQETRKYCSINQSYYYFRYIKKCSGQLYTQHAYSIKKEHLLGYKTIDHVSKKRLEIEPHSMHF